MLINKEAELVSEWWPHELKIDLFVQLTQIMVSTKMKNKFVYYIVLKGSITYMQYTRLTYHWYIYIFSVFSLVQLQFLVFFFSLVFLTSF